MPLQIIQCIANNLMLSIGVPGVNVINSRVNWMTSTATFGGSAFFHFEDHFYTRKSALPFLFDESGTKV